MGACTNAPRNRKCQGRVPFCLSQFWEVIAYICERVKGTGGQTKALTGSPSSPDKGQNHDRCLIVPARHQTLAFIYWRWLELSKQFLEKTTTLGQPVNRSRGGCDNLFFLATWLDL